MFAELYEVARHTPLQILVTPRGERLSVIVLPKGDDENSALAQPISAIGTPAELDAELPAKLAEYCARANELRLAIDLPIAALDAEKEKETKRAKKPATAKPAKPPRPAAAAKPKRSAKSKPAAKKPAKPARSIAAPGMSAKPPAKRAAVPARSIPKGVKTGPLKSTPRASRPGKPECLADMRAYIATGKPLTRAAFIAWARRNGNKTGRRYEKLWKNWEDFIGAEAITERVRDAIDRAAPPAEPEAPREHAVPSSAAKSAPPLVETAAASGSELGNMVNDLERKLGARARAVYTATGVLLGSTLEELQPGGKYTSVVHGEFTVSEAREDRYIVAPAEAAASAGA